MSPYPTTSTAVANRHETIIRDDYPGANYRVECSCGWVCNVASNERDTAENSARRHIERATPIVFDHDARAYQVVFGLDTGEQLFGPVFIAHDDAEALHARREYEDHAFRDREGAVHSIFYVWVYQLTECGREVRPDTFEAGVAPAPEMRGPSTAPAALRNWHGLRGLNGERIYTGAAPLTEAA